MYDILFHEATKNNVAHMHHPSAYSSSGTLNKATHSMGEWTWVRRAKHGHIRYKQVWWTDAAHKPVNIDSTRI